MKRHTRPKKRAKPTQGSAASGRLGTPWITVDFTTAFQRELELNSEPTRTVDQAADQTSERGSSGCLSQVLLIGGAIILLPSLYLVVAGLGAVSGPSGEGVTIGLFLLVPGAVGSLIGGLMVAAGRSQPNRT